LKVRILQCKCHIRHQLHTLNKSKEKGSTNRPCRSAISKAVGCWEVTVPRGEEGIIIP